jgi:PAS domain S-box-containing protein
MEYPVFDPPINPRLSDGAAQGASDGDSPREALLATAFLQLPESVAIIDATERVLLANERMKALIATVRASSESTAEQGPDLSENLERALGLRTDGEPYAEGEWPWRRALRHGETVQSEPLELARPDGSRLFLEVSVAPLQDAAGAIAAAVVTLHDAAGHSVAELARRQAMAIARENLDRFRSIFEQASVGMAQLRLDGHFLIANVGLCSLLGYTPEDLAQLSITDITHPDDIETDRRSRESVLQGREKVQTLEKRFLRKDGSPVWVNATLSLTRNATGEILSVLEIVQDISARKSAEGALEISEARFRLACDSAHLGVFDRDLLTDEMHASPQAERLFGFEANDPRPTRRDWLMRIHPDDVVATSRAFDRAAREKNDLYAEYRVVCPDGSTRWIGDTSHPIWENGRPVRSVGVLQDITARKEAEIALRLSEERFRSLATATAAIIIIAAGNGMVIEEMQGWGDYTGQSFAQSRGSGWAQMVHPDDREAALAAWKAGVEKKALIENRFRLWHAPSQSYRHVALRGVPILSERRRVREWVATFSDIHERLCAQADLERSRLLFEHIAKVTPGALYLYDLDRRCMVYVNDGVLSLLGYTPEQVLDMNDAQFRELLHPDDRPRARHALAQLDALAANAALENEYHVRHADGEYRWIYTRTVAFSRNADGHVHQVLGFALDITPHKRAAQALELSAEELRRSQERYRTFLHQSTEGIWRLEFEHAVPVDLPVDEQIERIYASAYLAECNDAMARMYGFDSGEALLGTRLGDLLPSDDPRNRAYLKAVIENGYRAVNIESTERDDEGNARTFLNNLVGIVHDGKVVRAWGLQRDITSQRQAEAARLESEERLRMALDAAHMGVWVWDNDAGRSVRSFRLLGPQPWGDTTSSYQTLEQRVHPEDRERLHDMVDWALAGSGEFEGECRVVWPDNSIRWTALRGRVFQGDPRIPDGERRPPRMSGVIYDITPRKNMEEELKRAHEELRQAARELERRVHERTAQISEINRRLEREIEERAHAQAARRELLQHIVTVQEEERHRISRELHDQMGQGLTALLMGLKALPGLPGEASPPGSQARLAQLQTLTEELMEQVHRLAWELRPAALDTLGLEEALREHVREWSRASGIEADFLCRGFGKKVRPSLPVEATLYRVVQEALTNVQRHAGATSVGIVLEAKKDRICATVEDNGCGFAWDDATGFDNALATGRLGLLGMKERLEMTGGQLEIESAPGAGTTVIARLPLDSHSTSTSGPAQAAPTLAPYQLPPEGEEIISPPLGRG